MDKRGWRDRQAQWERFHAWESSPDQLDAWPSGEEAARIVGELIELYRSTTPPRPHDELNMEKIRGIQQMHRLLQRLRVFL